MCTAAHGDGGARGKGEGEGVWEVARLTLRVTVWTERGGEDGRRRISLVAAATGGGRDEDGGVNSGRPATTPSAGRTRGARRISWQRRRELGRPESTTGSTAATEDVGSI